MFKFTPIIKYEWATETVACLLDTDNKKLVLFTKKEKMKTPHFNTSLLGGKRLDDSGGVQSTLKRIAGN